MRQKHDKTVQISATKILLQYIWKSRYSFEGKCIFFSNILSLHLWRHALAVHGRAVVVGETDMNLWMSEFSVYIRYNILDVPATMFHVGDGCKTCVILWLKSGGLHRCLGRWHGRRGCAASTTVTWKNWRYPRATWLVLARWHDVRQPVVKLWQLEMVRSAVRDGAKWTSICRMMLMFRSFKCGSKFSTHLWSSFYRWNMSRHVPLDHMMPPKRLTKIRGMATTTTTTPTIFLVCGWLPATKVIITICISCFQIINW